MYKVGQEINIGIYGGFKSQSKLKRKAKIVSINDNIITIRVSCSPGGYRRMFGTEYDLKKLEENYKEWR